MSELLFDPHLRGPMKTRTASGASQWAGSTILGSGTALVTVSTALVKSDSLILAQPQYAGVSSNFAINVRTIIDSTSFTFGYSNDASIPASVTIFWMLINQ